MSFDRLDIMDLLIAITVFGLVISLWIGWVLFWSVRKTVHERKIQRRLDSGQAVAGGARILSLWHDGQETVTVVSGRTRRRWTDRIDRLFAEAGWEKDTRNTAVVLLVLTVLVLPPLTWVFMGGVMPGLGLAAAVLFLFWTFFSRRIARRTALFDNQLVDALDLAARSLRAGHPLVGAFRLLAEETPPPVGTLFADVCQQQDLGVGLDEAIRRIAATSHSQDLKLLATSVVIQLRTGGNLADMMERAAYVIRDRLRLSRRVKVLTAQTQFSKRILLGLPFLIFVVLNVLNPDYMEPLYSEQSGRMLLLGATISLLSGAWMMNRLSVFRY